MAFRGVCIPSSNHHYSLSLLPNLSSFSSSRKPTPHLPLSISSFSTAAAETSSSSNVKWRECSPSTVGRRVIATSFVGFGVSRFLFMSKAMAEPALELHRYTDPKEGFTLLVPFSWIKVDKAGATVLFEDANKKANNVGVVVAPTRISSLGEFGTPQFVVDKLIQAERRKESTKEAEVISVSERSGEGGVQVYEFEYKVDSSRGGMKRVFSAAVVASKRLYLLNITHSDSVESPLDTNTRNVLEQILHSFDVAPSS
ncbi:PsbP domain-containing protein 2, chloroplastic [Salvia divinorum]|uniref:PsbP domain-containing protein 2, chloroplastic n=1 Tax=Salvia divinorum TaxID=28513 RepID=A0ABD1G737_SALDI